MKTEPMGIASIVDNPYQRNVWRRYPGLLDASKTKKAWKREISGSPRRTLLNSIDVRLNCKTISGFPKCGESGTILAPDDVGRKKRSF